MDCSSILREVYVAEDASPVEQDSLPLFSNKEESALAKDMHLARMPDNSTL